MNLRIWTCLSPMATMNPMDISAVFPVSENGWNSGIRGALWGTSLWLKTQLIHLIKKQLEVEIKFEVFCIAEDGERMFQSLFHTLMLQFLSGWFPRCYHPHFMHLLPIPPSNKQPLQWNIVLFLDGKIIYKSLNFMFFFFRPILSLEASTSGWHAVECLGTLWIPGGTDSGAPGGGGAAANPSRQRRENTCSARLFSTLWWTNIAMV